MSDHAILLREENPIALAYQWIVNYAYQLSDGIDEDDGDEITADELIDTAMSHIDKETLWGGDYVVRGGHLEGEYTDSTFWDKLAILKGIIIPEEDRINFFSCSC